MAKKDSDQIKDQYQGCSPLVPYGTQGGMASRDSEDVDHSKPVMTQSMPVGKPAIRQGK